MFPTHTSQQSVIASQLAAELADYELGLAELLEDRWDPELYRTLSDQFDRMQMYASALPRLSLVWTELLISRVELTHALWSLRTPSRIDGKVTAMYAQHRMRIQEAIARCLRYVGTEPLALPKRPAGA